MVLCFYCGFFRGLFVRLREAPPCAVRPAGSRECRPRQDGIAADLASRASCALLNKGGDERIGFGYGLL